MKNKQGQALVVILILMVVMVMVTTVAVAAVLVNSQNTSKEELGNLALAAAESGAENALLMLLRDPYGYTGDNLILPNGARVEVTVPVGNYPKIVTAMGKNSYFTRTLIIGVNYTNNIMVVTSWKESY